MGEITSSWHAEKIRKYARIINRLVVRRGIYVWKTVKKSKRTILPTSVTKKGEGGLSSGHDGKSIRGRTRKKRLSWDGQTRVTGKVVRRGGVIKLCVGG